MGREGKGRKGRGEGKRRGRDGKGGHPPPIFYCTQFQFSRNMPDLDIFLFPPITQFCSISDVLFTGGRGVSDFSVLNLKYY